MTRGLIDIHQHLIYDVDDGPKTWLETEAMLADAVRQGIEWIIATPHVSPGRVHFDYKSYLKKLNGINRFVEERGWKLRLLPGAEIFYTSQTLKKLDAAEIPTLAMSRYILVEFSPAVKTDYLFNALRQLANSGYLPIVAHVERYRCLRDNPQTLQELRNFNVLFQMNAQTILHSNDLLGKRFIRSMLKNDLVDFVATDAHNTSSRPVCLQNAYDFLKKHYDSDLADWLTGRSQERILATMNAYNPENA